LFERLSAMSYGVSTEQQKLVKSAKRVFFAERPGIIGS